MSRLSINKYYPTDLDAQEVAAEIFKMMRALDEELHIDMRFKYKSVNEIDYDAYPDPKYFVDHLVNSWDVRTIRLDGAIIGNIMADVSGEDWHTYKESVNICNLYLKPEFRSHGYGEEAMRLIIEDYKPRCKSVTLQVYDCNHKAMKFYLEKLKFKPLAHTLVLDL